MNPIIRDNFFFDNFFYAHLIRKEKIVGFGYFKDSWQLQLEQMSYRETIFSCP